MDAQSVLFENGKWLAFSRPMAEALPNLPTSRVVLEGDRAGFDPDFIIPRVLSLEEAAAPHTSSYDVLLDGYFQSEKYFLHCEDLIRALFQPRRDIADNIETQHRLLFEEEYTSLHVRRGDYVTLSETHPLNPHPVQSLDYFVEALDFLNAKNVLVFSDDIEWCKEQFTGDKFRFMDQREHHPQEITQEEPYFSNLSRHFLVADFSEMVTMSKCTNHIISNSSFSWWGAWLNDNPDKKVVAPKNWFSEAHAQVSRKDPLNYLDDLLPPAWIRI